MIYRSGRVNPIAKALLQTNRRRPQVVPDKTKYNRKKDKDNANKVEKMTAEFDHDWNDVSIFEKLLKCARLLASVMTGKTSPQGGA